MLSLLLAFFNQEMPRRNLRHTACFHFCKDYCHLIKENTNDNPLKIILLGI